MIKLVAFDWNGTLIADTSALVIGVNQVLKLFEIKPTSAKEYQDHFDVPVTKTYIGLGVSEKVVHEKSSLIANAFHTAYEPAVLKSRTRANAKKVLTWLIKNNMSSIIFSNHIEDKIIQQLKRLSIDHYFSDVLANNHIESVNKGRNKQEKLNKYIMDSGLKNDQILIVGDTIEEIEIGKELGYTTVAITNGSCSKSRLISSKPDFLISNLSQVIGIINKLNEGTSLL